MKAPLLIDPLCGSHIRSVVNDALALARQNNRPVRFRFNGARITAHKRLSARHLLRQFDHHCAAASLKYRRSAAAFEQAKRDAYEVEEKQATVNALISMLPTVETMDAMMAWLHGFTPAADLIGVTFDHEAVAAALEAKGYIRGDLAGKAPEFYDTSERMGRWIAGQAIDYFRGCRGPHPVTERFVKQYLRLKRQERAMERTA